MEIKKYTDLPDEAKRIRTEVFLDEQKFSMEFDEIDDIAAHLVLFDDNGAAAGVCRYFFSEEKNCCMIGRVAVDKAHRGQGLGSVIMLEAEKLIREDGYSKIAVSAQCRVSPFYESLGYKKTGEEYLDEYCPHIMMVKEL